ncbi:MAG: ABC transporter ATP-binding protein [Candidatus Sumerlaeaceae bacterium]
MSGTDSGEQPGQPSVPAALTGKKKKPRLSDVWRESRDLVWAHRHRLALGLLLMLVSRAAALVLPATSKFVVDDVFTAGKHYLLLPLAIAAGVATIIQGITGFALSQILGVAAQRAITDMRMRVQQHISRLPVRYFDSTQTGVLISRVMNDADGIRNLVGTGLVQLTGSIVTSVCALGVLFYLNWQMTVVTLVMLALFGGGLSYAFSKIRPLFRERGKITADITGRLTESFGGIRVVKAYTAERREQIVFAKGAHKLFRLIARTVTGVSAVNSGGTAVAGIVFTVMILLGGRAFIHGDMTLGELTMYASFTMLMASPVIQLSSISTQITEAFAGLDRIREVLRLPTEMDEDAQRLPAPHVSGDIEFRDVSFSYEPGVRVLKNVSFHAAPGTTTALVGSSGSGKSTLIGLIMAFHRPQEGCILVDGRDLANLRLLDYRSHLGVVLQDNFLFDGTIAENIRFSRPQATMAEVLDAARIAHCDDFVSKFEKGYETIVGERGVRLSGGQRQRVAIARAILAQPRILILDEATSSLDSESEAKIQDGLSKLRQGRTSFVIAHRLSTIRSAEQILVLEGGEIIERGTHTELYQKEGRYRELHDRQYRFELERFVNPGEELIPPDAKVSGKPVAAPRHQHSRSTPI